MRLDIFFQSFYEFLFQPEPASVSSPAILFFRDIQRNTRPYQRSDFRHWQRQTRVWGLEVLQKRQRLRQGWPGVLPQQPPAQEEYKSSLLMTG